MKLTSIMPRILGALTVLMGAAIIPILYSPSSYAGACSAGNAPDPVFPVSTPLPGSVAAPPAPTTPAAPNNTPAAPTKPVPAPPIAQAIWIKGKVTANQPNQPPRALQRRSVIYEHDIIVTDNTSTGEIGFTDGSLVSLNNSSQFEIAGYNYKPNGGTADKAIMKLIKGGFRTITGAIPKENPTGYQMNTPVATIGVRGTEYLSVCVPNKGLMMQIEKGTIDVSNGSGSIKLTQCQGGGCKPFAVVQNFNIPAMPTAQRPPELINIAPVTPVPHGWGAPGMPGAEGTPPVPQTNYNPNSNMQHTKTVSHFCIGL